MTYILREKSKGQEWYQRNEGAFFGQGYTPPENGRGDSKCVVSVAAGSAWQDHAQTESEIEQSDH